MYQGKTLQFPSFEVTSNGCVIDTYFINSAPSQHKKKIFFPKTKKKNVYEKCLYVTSESSLSQIVQDTHLT